jgi:hypothetical protein
MRSTAKLIDEIEAEGKGFTSLFLLCRLGERTEQVEHSATRKLDKLNDIVSRGGIPFAMIGYMPADNHACLDVYTRLLKEYLGDRESLSFLQAYLPTIGAAIHRSGLTPNYVPTGQWPMPSETRSLGCSA